MSDFPADIYTEPDAVLTIPGVPSPFHHTDRNTLTKIGEPTPNALAAQRRSSAL
jgi:hypothetical protein